LTPTEKWKLVQAHYENAYRDSHGLKIQFKKPLSEQDIDFLYDSLMKLQKSLKDFYENQAWLVERLLRLRGQLRDPVKKRKPHE
jgi:hypothetical protein